jgi:predicted ArsR family transcriptional regulator
VKSLQTATPASGTAERRTRERVARLLLEGGPQTTVELAESLGLGSAAVRRHLEAMLSEGEISSREQPINRHRGRGRPARVFLLTEAGRGQFPHTYDDMATAALRYLAEHGGPDAIERFAAERVAQLEDRCRAAMDQAGDDRLARAQALAEALSAEGYAASTTAIAAGGQLCQHHCPVAHVAAEFPQLCDAETAVIGRLVGSHVQRLATIAHGDGVCTTYIPMSSLTGSGRTPA